MASHETKTGPWELTDEEWCELCFMVIDLRASHETLEKTLLAEERPTLHQLWVAMSAYCQASDRVSDYVSDRLRLKAGIDRRKAA